MAAKPCPFSRPIPFQPEMIRAVLDGVKTQTRRAVHLPAVKWLLKDPAAHEHVAAWFGVGREAEAIAWNALAEIIAGEEAPLSGALVALADGFTPRDQRFLWVREWLDVTAPFAVTYESDGSLIDASGEAYDWVKRYAEKNTRCPPMHMPRAVSRLTLEVEQVRVQRLQDITEEDARAEGPSLASGDSRRLDPTYRVAFANLWTGINGPESWDANPLVCAITFKVHYQNIDTLLIKRGLVGDAR